MPKPPPDTRWDGALHWFALAKAASLAGLTKAKLTALGDSGKVQMVEDEATGELWFERLEILKLYDARMARKRDWKERNPDGVKRKPKTQEQIEKDYADQSAELRKTIRRSGRGPVSEHYDKVMLMEIAEAERLRKQSKVTKK